MFEYLGFYSEFLDRNLFVTSFLKCRLNSESHRHEDGFLNERVNT